MKKTTNPVFKLIFMGVVIGILLIANVIIGAKLDDRKYTSNDAKRQISNAAGGNFHLKDCYLSIPWVYTYYEKNDKGVNVEHKKYGTEVIKAKSSKIDANVVSEDRTIGIYSFPIYFGEVNLNAEFDISQLKYNKGYTYSYDIAEVYVGCSDKSFQSRPVFTVNNVEYPTEFVNTSGCDYIKAKCSARKDKIVFNTNLKIRGADRFRICVFAPETYFNVTSDWCSPGFSDFSYLPNDYDITEKGFTASWYVPFDACDSSNDIGFDYIQPVNLYKKLDRAINYGFLFIIVPFIILFLFEIFASVNLHPMNYLLSGAASVLFFLLLLSMSEHMKFGVSYLLGALASGLLVSVYIASITKKIKLGIFMSISFILLYGYLFVCLQSEDFALLMGAIFAFVILATIMFVTRKVDWSNLKKVTDTDLMKE